MVCEVYKILYCQKSLVIYLFVIYLFVLHSVQAYLPVCYLPVCVTFCIGVFTCLLFTCLCYILYRRIYLFVLLSGQANTCILSGRLHALRARLLSPKSSSFGVLGHSVGEPSLSGVALLKIVTVSSTLQYNNNIFIRCGITKTILVSITLQYYNNVLVWSKLLTQTVNTTKPHLLLHWEQGWHKSTVFLPCPGRQQNLTDHFNEAAKTQVIICLS